jgi:hypothetical protein
MFDTRSTIEGGNAATKMSKVAFTIKRIDNRRSGRTDFNQPDVRQVIENVSRFWIQNLTDSVVIASSRLEK